MALKGELLSADLSNVFQMLAMNGKRGLLTVQDRVNPVARKRFFLDGQTVLLAEGVPARPSLPLLVEMGRVPYEQYASAMQRAKRFNSDPFGILKAQGAVDDEDLEAYRTRASNEVLLEVFLWRDIRFTLDETVNVAPNQNATPIQLDHVIMEAARRQDEWKHVVEAVGSHRDIFRRCQDAGDGAELGAVERIVLEALNGIDGTADLMARCELPRYFVDLSLASLLRAGRITRVGPEELIMSGDKLVEAGQVRDGIRLFHCALRSDRSNVAIHKRLAGAHVEAGEFARASGHLRFCSLMELQAGREREALTLLQQSWQLLPTHFSTLERILSVLQRSEGVLTKEDRDCVADGRRLLQVWQDTGESERAVELASRIWSIDQSDREVLHTAARLNVRLGRTEAAVASYVALAERLRSDHDLRGALDVYRTASSLDGGQGAAYEHRMEELRGEVENIAARKKRGKALRAAVFVSIVASIVYAGYAWYADQRVQDLDEQRVSDVASREQLVQGYEKAAMWFQLTPAGKRARDRADTLVAEADAERAVLQAAEEAAAAKLAAQHRIAEGHFAEGLRMVRVGELEDAAERLKAAIGTFPGKTAAASRAAKALADVESYLAGGRRLLADATTLDATDPDAAFRLRLKALRDFELVPEVKQQRLALTIETIPPQARLLVHGDEQEYTAPIGISVGGQGVVAVEARAEGFVPRTVSLTLPPEVATWTVVLERASRATVKVGDPLACAAAFEPGKALLTARNGPAFVLDVATGAIVARHEPEGLDSQSRPPVLSGSRALVVLDDGRCRILELPSLSETRIFRLPVQPRIAPTPYEDGWIVATAPDRIEILGPDGAAKRVIPLAADVVMRDVAVVGCQIVCACGEVGVLVIDANTGAIRTASDKMAGGICAGPEGSVFVHRPQVGVVRIDLLGFRESVVFPHKGDSATIRRIRGDRWVALFDGEVQFLSSQGPAGRARLPDARADGMLVLDAFLGRAGVVVEGWCSVLDFSTGRPVAGFACEPGLQPAFVERAFVNVHADGRATITDE
jgi:tetratricopeptide (TPR) repeat protein